MMKNHISVKLCALLIVGSIAADAHSMAKTASKSKIIRAATSVGKTLWKHKLKTGAAVAVVGLVVWKGHRKFRKEALRKSIAEAQAQCLRVDKIAASKKEMRRWLNNCDWNEELKKLKDDINFVFQAAEEDNSFMNILKGISKVTVERDVVAIDNRIQRAVKIIHAYFNSVEAILLSLDDNFGIRIGRELQDFDRYIKRNMSQREHLNYPLKFNKDRIYRELSIWKKSNLQNIGNLTKHVEEATDLLDKLKLPVLPA